MATKLSATSQKMVHSKEMTTLLECICLGYACAKKCAEMQDSKLCQLCTDCACCCEIALQLKSRESTFCNQMLVLCAKICKQCVADCSQCSDSLCKEFAEVCKECADQCLESAKS